MLEKAIQSWFDKYGQEVKDLAKRLWELSETALEEYELCKLTSKFMEKHGFKVAVHAGMALAQCGFDIAEDPSVIKVWRKNLDEQLEKEGGNIKPIFPERKG